MPHSFTRKIGCLVLIGTLLASPALACGPLEDTLAGDTALEKSASTVEDSCTVPPLPADEDSTTQPPAENDASPLPPVQIDNSAEQPAEDDTPLLPPAPEEAEALPKSPAQDTPDPLSLTAPLTIDDTTLFARSGGTITGFSSAFLKEVSDNASEIIYVDLLIPAEINGTPITTIGSRAFLSSQKNLPDNLRIRTLDLSQASALTQIDDYAFYNTSGPLYDEFASTQLVLPDSLQTIGSNAFNGLKTFRGDLLLPDSVTAIGNSGFQNCGFDGRLTLPSNEGYTTIHTQTFKDNHFTGTLTLPSQITVIEGNYAFAYNDFTDIVWPDNLEVISASSFIGCTQLRHLPPLPATLQTLGNQAFKNCAQLDNQSIRLPDALTEVGNSIFDGTPIQTVYLPDNLNTIYADQFFFSDSAITALVAPNQAIYDVFRQSQYGDRLKYCAYPLTLTFYDPDGNAIGTREVLYNRPLNFSLEEATGVWSADDAYALPELNGGAVLGYELSWSFQANGTTAATKNSLVTGDSLKATLTLQKPTVLTPQINTLSKTYDGKPLTLSVELEHPLEGTNVGDVYIQYKFDRAGYSNNPSKNYLQNGAQSTYNKIVNVSDSASGGNCWYIARPLVCQITAPGKAKGLYYLPDIYFYVTINPATPAVHPAYIPEAEPGTTLASVALALSDGDTPGQLAWQDSAQTVANGTKEYDWSFTPDDQENYLPLTGTLTLNGQSASAPLPPTATLTSGTYRGSQQVALQSTNADERIYYTTDGSDPAASPTALLYQAATPLYLNKSLILRAAVQNSSGRFSDSIRLEYIITAQSEAIIPPESTEPLLPANPSVTPDQVDVVYHEAVEPDKQETLAATPLPEGFTASGHFFELKLTINLVPQEEAQLAHKITVSIPYAGKDSEQYKIAHLKSDQTVEILDAQWHPENQTLQFAIDSFSPFLVLAQSRPSSGGGTSDNADQSSAAQPKVSYRVTAASGQGGHLEPEGTITLTAGSQKTWRILPDAGFIIGEVRVDNRSIGAADHYTLTAIQANHTITATFLPQLDDIYPEAWYYEAVLSAYRQQLIRGVADHTFAPEDTVSRAMAAALLHRLSGEPTCSAVRYEDVSASDWYAQPISWLTANGLAFGYPDGGFHPTATLARQELAALLYRYAAFRGLSVTAPPDAVLADFSDTDQIDAWAREPLAWAAAHGLLTADSDNRLRPTQAVTRAELAAIVIRFTALLP